LFASLSPPLSVTSSQPILLTRLKLQDKSEHERLAQELAQAKNNWVVYERTDIQLRQDIKHLKEKNKSLANQIEKDKAKLGEKSKLLKTYQQTVRWFFCVQFLQSKFLISYSPFPPSAPSLL